MPPRCPGQPPAAPGPSSRMPTSRSCSRGARGPAAPRLARGKDANLFKPVFKLNADAPAPGTTGPRPAERLACARRRTGGRASACKTLASQQLELQSLFSIEGSHYWTALRFQTLRVYLAGLHWFPLHSKTLEAAGAQPIGSTRRHRRARRQDIVPRAHESCQRDKNVQQYSKSRAAPHRLRRAGVRGRHA